MADGSAEGTGGDTDKRRGVAQKIWEDEVSNTGYPPLGAKPEKFALYDRAEVLSAAIERYLAAGMAPRPEWADELGRIARRILEIEAGTK